MVENIKRKNSLDEKLGITDSISCRLFFYVFNLRKIAITD